MTTQKAEFANYLDQLTEEDLEGMTFDQLYILKQRIIRSGLVLQYSKLFKKAWKEMEEKNRLPLHPSLTTIIANFFFPGRNNDSQSKKQHKGKQSRQKGKYEQQKQRLNSFSKRTN